MLLIDRLLAAVERTPEAPAIILGDAPMSYRMLLACVSNAVKHLHESGIRPGQLVALTMTQSPLHFVTFLALARLGAVVLPVSTVLGPAQRAALVRKFGATRAVADREVAEVEGCAPLLLKGVRARGDEKRLDYSGFVPEADAPLRIALTSGTTGTPKGVMQTHGSFAARLDRLFCGEARNLRVIPPNLSITIALNLSLFALGGGTVVIPLGYGNESIFAAIRRHGVTLLPIVPSHLAHMVAVLPERGPAFPPSTQLRFLGATPSARLLELARERFSVNMCLPYATAELGAISMATPEMLARWPASSGRVLPGARLEVVDAAGRPAAAGVSGEIRIAVDGMPRGYLRPDADDRSRFRGAWFHPGDRGHLSAEGLVFVEGRTDEIINMGGRKVAPQFAEAALEEHPGVAAAAVFVSGQGVEGPRLTAAVVASGPLDLGTLHRHALARLEVLAPVRYVKVRELPRNDMGKIVRDALPALVEGPGVVDSFFAARKL